MPLNLNPSFASLPPTPENLQWVFLKCQSLGKQVKRSRGGPTDDDGSNSKVARSSGLEGSSSSGGPTHRAPA
eukprot:6665996-Pyramimonas_sp.AAC.1